MTSTTKKAAITTAAPRKPIDELAKNELDDRLAETLHHIDAIRQLWPGLVGLPDQARRTSSGRTLRTLAPALRALFGVLRPRDGREPPFAKLFDVLGDEDDGADPERFEVELLARRIDRIEAEQKIQAELDALRRTIADDILSTGAKVVGPGTLALRLARSIANGNATHRATLAPVLNALSSLTQRARHTRAAQESASAAAASPQLVPA